MSEARSPPKSPWKMRLRTGAVAGSSSLSAGKKRKNVTKDVKTAKAPRKAYHGGKEQQEQSDDMRKSKELFVEQATSLVAATMRKPPSYKTVVQMLTTPLREEPKTFRNKNGVEQTKTYLVYKCPNQHCKEKNREIWFQKSMGFINPFNHLKTCIADGKVEQLYMVYDQKRESKRLHVSGTFFQPTVDRMTTRELAMNDFLRLIVLKNLPLSIVEDEEFRKFHRYSDVISKRLLKDTIFKLVDIVDRKLGEEMKAAGKGSILHDGWTCAGVHYIAILACYPYTAGVKVKEETKQGDHEVEPENGIRLSLVSVSPMARTEDCAEGDDDEAEVFDETAVNFSSATHAEHIRNVFRYYGIDVEDWAVCQTADNCSVNLKVADLLGISHVACKNHLLNLEVNEMVKQHRDLEGTLNTIHETMSQCKKKLKNAALLRNLVNLVPVLHNKTRWSGKLYMMERFLRIRDELIAVAENENSDLQINSTAQFRNKVTRYCGHMEQINYSTKYMQTRKLTLCQCRDSLNMLMQDVEEGRDNKNSVMFRCLLGNKYISEHANILKDPDFELGVCKIQEGLTDTMTEEEKTACEKLLLERDEESGESSEEELAYEERLRRRKQKRENPSGYMDCDFILGSAAEVERLWSIANHVLTDERKKTSPLMLEALLFLRVNIRLWDIHTVKQAYHMSRNERVDKNIEEDNQLAYLIFLGLY